MKLVQYSRYLLQIIALVIFCHQSRTAVEKYLSNMTVASVEYLSWKEMPDIAVNMWLCATDQYDEEKGKAHGYDHIYAWYMGKDPLGNGSVLDWAGSSNLSSTAFKQELFPIDYDTVGFAKHYPHPSKALLKNISFEAFMVNIGRCIAIDGLKKPTAPTYDLSNNTESYNLYIFDQKEPSLCGLSETSLFGDPITSTARQNLVKFYKIKLEVIEWNSGSYQCTQYNQADESQGWKFMSCSHGQELGQQASWLLMGCMHKSEQPIRS